MLRDDIRALVAPPRLALYNWVYLLLVMAVVAGILTAAMVMQYVYRELPCPLCLLQRVALFGVCFGIMQNFRHGFSYRNTGYSLLFVIFLLIVATRQTLLDIYPRPGHAYIGSAIFGLHMPVWSIVIALALLTAYAVKLAVLGGDQHLRDYDAKSFPVVCGLANVLTFYVIALCLINLVSVIVQCGLGQCHTTGYRLLG